MAKSDDVARLEAVAESWVGTPWCDNSAEKGRGACCHLLMAAVYREAGWLDVTPPRGVANAARWANKSVMLEWLRGPGAQWFVEVPREAIRPGDLMVLCYGHVAHHLAIVLSGERVLHVTHSQGVQIVRVQRAWQRLLAAAFAPIDRVYP